MELCSSSRSRTVSQDGRHTVPGQLVEPEKEDPGQEQGGFREDTAVQGGQGGVAVQGKENQEQFEHL